MTHVRVCAFFVNIFDRCFLLFTKKEMSTHPLSGGAWGGTSPVNVSCSTPIHELDVGVMNGCLQPYVPDFVMAKRFSAVNCNKGFRHVQNNLPSRWSGWWAFQPWTNVEGNHLRISAAMRHHFFACTCDRHKCVATTSSQHTT